MAASEDERRAKAEAELCDLRIIELTLMPVRGSFDADHLREINRRIFQDLPAAGFPDVTPGEYRPQIAPGKDWMKMRGLDSAPGAFFVAYSKMDARAQERLGDALKAADPSALKSLDTKTFVASMTKLYAELDYIHPFADGNSRTLRAFTGQLAKEAGYDLNWTQISESPVGRDALYIARDLAVIELAKPHIEHPNNMMKLVTTLHRLDGNRNLQSLLTEAIRPSRAVAFEKYAEPEAVKVHPELVPAYQFLTVSSHYLINKYPGDAETIERGMKLANGRIQEVLNRNEIPKFQLDKTLSKPERSPGSELQKGPEPER